jgi:hypothetical protein
LAQVFPQSLTAEILKLLGPEQTEKFLMVFAGTTIKVPTTKDVQEAERNLAIYDTLKKAKSPPESRRLGETLAEQYNISRYEVRELYRLTRKMLNEGRILTEADIRTGHHQRSRVKVVRKKKRSM